MESAINHERELREAWQLAHAQQHAAEAEALRMARVDIDRRLDAMNQLRDQITQERGTFLARDLYDREHLRLRKEFDDRLKRLETSDANLQGRILATGAILAFLLSVVAVLARLWK